MVGPIERKDRRPPGPKVIAARTVAGIPKLRHEPVPALRDVPVVDAGLGWTRRKSIAGQRGDDHIKVFKHRQYINVIEKTAGPAVREDERQPPARCRRLMHKVNPLPGEVMERVEPSLPGTPVELIGPVGNEASKPVQLGALFPAYAWNLVGPSGMAQPCPQIVEHLIRDMNPKGFQSNTSLLASGRDRPSARGLGRIKSYLLGQWYLEVIRARVLVNAADSGSLLTRQPGRKSTRSQSPCRLIKTNSIRQARARLRRSVRSSEQSEGNPHMKARRGDQVCRLAGDIWGAGPELVFVFPG